VGKESENGAPFLQAPPPDWDSIPEENAPLPARASATGTLTDLLFSPAAITKFNPTVLAARILQANPASLARALRACEDPHGDEFGLLYAADPADAGESGAAGQGKWASSSGADKWEGVTAAGGAEWRAPAPEELPEAATPSSRGGWVPSPPEEARTLADDEEAAGEGSIVPTQSGSCLETWQMPAIAQSFAWARGSIALPSSAGSPGRLYAWGEEPAAALPNFSASEYSLRMYEQAGSGNASSRVQAIDETAGEAAAAMATGLLRASDAPRPVRNHGALPPARRGRPQSGRKIRFADEEEGLPETA
jgi:hypothetical protein